MTDQPSDADQDLDYACNLVRMDTADRAAYFREKTLEEVSELSLTLASALEQADAMIRAAERTRREVLALHRELGIQVKDATRPLTLPASATINRPGTLAA